MPDIYVDVGPMSYNKDTTKVAVKYATTAQKLMREKVAGVSIALMMGSMLHSIAVGNLLPASVKTICVDINPSVVTKLADRGTFQAIGLVTDIEPFLRELTEFLAEEN